MTSDARASKRRTDRTKANDRAGNGGPPDAPPNDKITSEKDQPDPAVAEGVFIVVVHDEAGNLAIQGIVPQGDVRPAEMYSILIKGLQLYEEQTGLGR